jgi:hypothetical protein
MEKNPFKWPIAIIGGIIVCLTELLFNLPAILLWPGGDYTPFTYFHSDLGGTKPHRTRGPLNSPLGAQFYNCGQVFQGLGIILFAGGLYVFYQEEKKRSNQLLYIGQFFGFLAGIGLIMNGVYSVDFQPEHGQWSQVLFLSIFLAEVFVNIALYKHPNFKRPIAIYGLLAAALNLAIVALFDILYPAYFLEYLGVFIAETWLALITINIFINEVWKQEE